MAGKIQANDAWADPITPESNWQVPAGSEEGEKGGGWMLGKSGSEEGTMEAGRGGTISTIDQRVGGFSDFHILPMSSCLDLRLALLAE